MQWNYFLKFLVCRYYSYFSLKSLIKRKSNEYFADVHSASVATRCDRKQKRDTNLHLVNPELQIGTHRIIKITK